MRALEAAKPSRLGQVPPAATSRSLKLSSCPIDLFFPRHCTTVAISTSEEEQRQAMGELVVADCNGAEVLEPIEKAFDQVGFLVEGEVAGARLLAGHRS